MLKTIGLRFGLVLIAFAGATAALAREAAGDADHGQKLFLQCRACHTVAKAGANDVGPNLWGVVGANAGSHSGYKYSAALSASGIVWNDTTLDQWLTRPTALVPSTNMAFQGVAAPKSRADLIAYLTTLGAKP